MGNLDGSVDGSVDKNGLFAKVGCLRKHNRYGIQCMAMPMASLFGRLPYHLIFVPLVFIKHSNTWETRSDRGGCLLVRGFRKLGAIVYRQSLRSLNGLPALWRPVRGKPIGRSYEEKSIDAIGG